MVIAFLGVEFFFLEKETLNGTLERKRCENTFSFFADRGRFEFLVKAGERYDWKKVPKGLCNNFLEGRQMRLVMGEVTGITYVAEQESGGTSQGWRLFGVREALIFGLLFFSYIPRLTRNPVGIGAVFVLCYVAYRWLVVVF